MVRRRGAEPAAALMVAKPPLLRPRRLRNMAGMLLLASQSPQRRMLLTQAGLAHVCVATADDETLAVPANPQAAAVERAIHKALHADLAAHGAAIAAGSVAVLAADTVVSLRGRLIGKPADRSEAVRILMELQGSRHLVVTAHCVLRPGPSPVQAVGLSVAKVSMAPMSPEEIQDYVDSGESDGKAGAYAYQESGDRFVEELEGDPATVIGLHVPTVLRLLREVGLPQLGEARP
jgi:septum formation protein